MNVAGDHCRQCPHPGAALCIGRQEWRLGICLIEILDDRQRLDQERVIDLQRRYETLWIDIEKPGLPLIAAPQMDKGALVI